MNLFEVNILFREEGHEKDTKKVYLINALTYAESEYNITQYLLDYEEVKDFKIPTMKRTHYDDFVYKENQDDYFWSEAIVKMKTSDAKEISFKYLVADVDLKSATRQLEEFLKDSDGECKITSIKEKPISDIVIRKECCKECSVCESNVRIISFEEQKGLDLKFSELDKLNSEIMIELGAKSLSLKKYVVDVNKKNIKNLLGKRLGGRIIKTWKEDFIDEDSGQVVSVERNEVLLNIGCEIGEEDLEIILESKVKEVKLYR